eukprot:GHVP01021168.1.p1 GENE.GHVP01021168.1~~GHVP01021168.1.p1  ORF type:complete len:372 (-),score=61.15 GHVP01021168.1:1612-2727(-)
MEPVYFYKNGRRIVRRHKHTHKAFIKERWFGRDIISVLCQEFKGKDKEYYIEAMEKGRIRINGKKCLPNTILNKTSSFTHEEDIEERELSCGKIIPIKWEDGIALVDKPSGIVIHPTGRHSYSSLTEMFKYDNKIDFCSPIFRLDKEVSGVMLLATTKKAASLMSEKMKQRNIKKEYICIVDGKIDEEIDCDSNIWYDYTKRKAICSDKKGSKSACTRFQRISYKNGRSLVSCSPKTGRMHQIRAHLAFLGFPISNDWLYNSKESESINHENNSTKEELDVLDTEDDKVNNREDNSTGNTTEHQSDTNREEKNTGKKKNENLISEESNNTENLTKDQSKQGEIWLRAMSYTDLETGVVYSVEDVGWIRDFY